MVFHQVLLLEVGNLQVFAYQTQEEINSKAPHGLVYFQDKRFKIVWGPFESIYQASQSYTNMLEAEKSPVANLAQVIHVDFKSRKRIAYA